MTVQAAQAPKLRLLAEDGEDLGVISAALQDAVARIGDIDFEPSAKQLTLALNRFRWEANAPRGGERIRTGLQFGGVLKVQARRLRRDAADAVVSLLAVEFQPSAALDDPGGVVHLRFSGDGDLRLEVECLDACLADLSEPWPTPRRPGHPDPEG